MKNRVLILGIAGGILLHSCSKDDAFKNANDPSLDNKTEQVLNMGNKEKYLVEFANILSKATYERSDVREFLKKEAVKQFDKNYDVLYYLIKDESIAGKSFRDILISYSSKDSVEEIEANVPLLNILVPEIAFFDINAENLDVTDSEIPVAVSREKTTSLFLNGKEEVNLQKGEVPDFHVFVVNENSRVIAPDMTAPATKSVANKHIAFISPNFDGSSKNEGQPQLKSLVDGTTVGQKAITAFSYFYKDDGSVNQKALQRDYIYYGITPTQQSGQLNRSVSEYLGFIEVNPTSYFHIADQRNPSGNVSTDDPYIKETTTTQKKRTLSEEELLERMWTKGAYNFCFEIIRSTDSKPQVVYVPLKPNEIWNFNITYSKRHKTSFRHSKHTYTIDPNKFTSKRVYLQPNEISLGKWDLSTEGMSRRVIVSEKDDETIETTDKLIFESTRIHSSKFNADVKLTLGLGKTASGSIGVGGESSSSSTVHESREVTMTRKEKSDDLGYVEIYFYDPIINSKSGSSYDIHTYNTGQVIFGLFVK